MNCKDYAEQPYICMNAALRVILMKEDSEDKSYSKVFFRFLNSCDWTVDRDSEGHSYEMCTSPEETTCMGASL